MRVPEVRFDPLRQDPKHIYYIIVALFFISIDLIFSCENGYRKLKLMHGRRV